MLKALEVHGFKSFADKTRFEFPAGITVVVGPNGSGKSNVVDAIKWVLGEQSAKSLRGKDMADVIFKGSGSASSNRKPMNYAEATIIFENSDRKLPVDAPEVHLTRRVYRSGEGEYLMNGQPCRLKDIKDLLRGTGVGIDAYSIIEQGKVERILQASSKDRRAMFEEAAGISRFKAKKVESQRRLERVEQNLLRLRDIVEEVDGRLKSTRAQAQKARRYREYSDRLKLLRTGTAAHDATRLKQQLDELRAQMTASASLVESLRAENETQERLALEREQALQVASDQLRQLENQQARTRETLHARLTSYDFERTRLGELQQEMQRRRQQITAMNSRVVGLRSRLKEIQALLMAAEAERAAHAAKLLEHETLLATGQAEAEQERALLEVARRAQNKLMRDLGELSSRSASATTQRETARHAYSVRKDRRDVVDQALQTYERDLSDLIRVEQEQAAVVQGKRDTLDQARGELDENRRLLSERQQELAHLHGRLRGASERATLLEDLEQRREGIETGVKSLLEPSRPDAKAPVIRGLVADVISAPSPHAKLIDTALGELSQAVVIDQPESRKVLVQEAWDTPGRVIFLGALPAPLASHVDIDLRGRAGVIERADRLATAAPGFEPLLQQLLGNTWCVETLVDAVRLRSEGVMRCRFVTRTGRRLEPDGTLIVGASAGAAGLISRRSELKSLRDDLAVIERLIREAELEVAELRNNIAQQEANVRRRQDEHQQAADTWSQRQVAIGAFRQRGEQLSRQRVGLEKELEEFDRLASDAETQLVQLAEERTRKEAEINEAEAEVRRLEAQLRLRDEQRLEHQQAVTLCRVDVARSDQRVDTQRVQFVQAQQDEHERDRLLAEESQQLTAAQKRFEQAELGLLNATSEIAELTVRKEQAAELILASSLEHARWQQERSQAAEIAQQGRRQLRQVEEALHAQQLAEGSVKHEYQSLLDRMRDDYGIDLEQLTAPTEADARERADIEEEIAALKRKVNSIGAVNLEALNEIDELEARHQHLSTQYEDLASAKAQLEKIIHKINSDSRRIFLETLEAIRTYFQALYRRAFGGGKADLVLEEGVDVLESGVDIMATPPGKPSFNNSLLSGGEKALTAVALLLAIFQFRPSPFCVLDEVDAPFDEANIGRFIDVVKDFLSGTRFIIVTHSKKTMTAANTLYGVTMQESGVSKRVSVRFDDVTDDGHIRREAIEREERADDRVA